MTVKLILASLGVCIIAEFPVTTSKFFLTSLKKLELYFKSLNPIKGITNEVSQRKRKIIQFKVICIQHHKNASEIFRSFEIYHSSQQHKRLNIHEYIPYKNFSL